jgi:hypothetical protein
VRETSFLFESKDTFLNALFFWLSLFFDVLHF